MNSKLKFTAVGTEDTVEKGTPTSLRGEIDVAG